MKSRSMPRKPLVPRTTMGNDLAIYQLHVQSADKLDERRDASVRAFGGMCVALTTAAAGTFERLPLLATVLSALLVVVAVAWLATLHSLTAKLTAKNRLLAETERKHQGPTGFLTRERQEWGLIGRTPLAKSLARAPWAFLLLGAASFLGTLAHLAWTECCLCP